MAHAALPPRRIISGFSNPTVKALRALRDKKHRRAERRFLVEGLRLLTDARLSGRLPEVLVMASGREPHPLLDALEQAVDAAGGEVIETDAAILCKITGKDNPQAVAGVFAEWDTSLAGIARSTAPIWLVAQALRDPGNLGTMLRTGDAVGAGGLILIDDCADPFSVEAVRASMGAVFTQNCGAGAMGGIPPLAARRRGAARRRLAARCRSIIAARPTRRHASSWSETNRAGCPRNTKTSAICASRSQCTAGAPTA